MASRVNVERLMVKKEKAIEKAMDKKERSIEFSNSLNNAVMIWTTIANHPEIEVNAALEEIRDIQQVILGFKGEPEPPESWVVPQDLRGPVRLVGEVFPDSKIQSPAPPEDKQIKDPEAPATEPQQKMIWAIMSRLGKSNDEKKVATSGLTKSAASARIKKLLAIEAESKEEVPF